MAKVVDLTEKLQFDKQPEIRIGKKTLKVNDDAESVLKLMGLAMDPELSEMEMIQNGLNLLFSEADLKKLNSLHLNFSSYTEVFKTAMALATGEDEGQQGEAETHTTT